MELELVALGLGCRLEATLILLSSQLDQVRRAAGAGNIEQGRAAYRRASMLKR